MTRVVGIGGKLASGKDAISDHLVENHGWIKLGMSDALADSLFTLDPWILLPTGLGWKNRFTAWVARLFRRQPTPVYVRYRELYNALGYVGAKENTEVRRLLQVLGTEVGRKIIDENIWTDIMVKRVKALSGPDVPGIVVTGIRFPNELEAISEELDGELWWVIRPAIVGAAITAGHASENSVLPSDFDQTIYNDGTLPQLYIKVDRLIT